MTNYKDYLLQNEETLKNVKSVDPDEKTFCLWYEYDCSLAFCYNSFGEWFWSNSLEEVKEAFVNAGVTVYECGLSSLIASCSLEARSRISEISLPSRPPVGIKNFKPLRSNGWWLAVI